MKKSPPAGAVDLLASTNAAAVQAGFSPSQWHAAIRLQCAVRDATDPNAPPPTLEQALDIATEYYRNHYF